jgi:hypothetical protein
MSDVSNLIQQAQSNLLSSGSGLGGGPFNSIFAVGTSNPAKNIADAQILNKSPLELRNDTSEPKPKANPYAFASTWYPEQVSNLGNGNYMIFDILATDAAYSSKTFSAFKGGNQLQPLESDIPSAQPSFKNAKEGNIAFGYKRVTNPSSGINAGAVGSRHTRIVNSIVLYTPPGIKTSYNTQYDTPETGFMGNVVGAGQGKGFWDSLLGAGTGILQGVANISNEIVSQAVSLIPGGGDLKAAQQKATGRSINPHLEMVFKSVPFREFDYTFEFAPKNKTELDRVQQILFLFRYHMQPELGLGNDFIVPSEFQITYMILSKRNAYIPRISKCVLKSMDIEHGDQTAFNTLATDSVGSAPVYTKMTLKFAETEIMTKTTVNKGF